MATYNVYLGYMASFTTQVEAESESEAHDKAHREFSPYTDEALADVEFSDRPLTTDVEEAS